MMLFLEIIAAFVIFFVPTYLFMMHILLRHDPLQHPRRKP